MVSGTSYTCNVAPATSQDKRSNPDIWKLAQFNVEWLFTEPYNDCPGNGCQWNSTEQEWVHLKTIADVVQSIDVDTLHLCEVQSCTQLEQLSTLVSQPYSPYLIEGTDTSTGQNVGLLSLIDPLENIIRTDDTCSYPVENSGCNYTGEQGTKGVSKNLISQFAINGLDIVLIGAHLLSKPLDVERCAEREAQSQVLQEQILSYVSGGYEVIMMGDFNDFDNEIADMNTNTPISHVLDILKGHDGTYKGKYELYSVANIVSQEDRFSEWWDANGNCVADKNEFSMIDHILMTQKLAEFLSHVQYVHTYDQSCTTMESDHYPIVVTFNFTAV